MPGYFPSFPRAESLLTLVPWGVPIFLVGAPRDRPWQALVLNPGAPCRTDDRCEWSVHFAELADLYAEDSIAIRTFGS
jgi:hypothetical protein